MIRVITLLALITGFAQAAASSAERLLVSPWLRFEHAELRLLAPAPDLNGEIEGGIEIRMKEGFKTYWRNPGDSGVPPRFDFSASQAIGIVEVHFPFPKAFDDGAGGKIWGYAGRVIFPFSARIMPVGRPVLRLNLDFAVCGTLCIPLNGILSLDGANAAAADLDTQLALLAARKAVPIRLDASREKPRLMALTRQGSKDRPSWRIRLALLDAVPVPAFFFDSAGYLAASPPRFFEEREVEFDVSGDPPPGSGGVFGPVLLVFGASGSAFELVLDLDGAQSPN
jgi:DsbC/DsbD-like thiol-disulfide interchange protein